LLVPRGSGIATPEKWSGENPAGNCTASGIQSLWNKAMANLAQLSKRIALATVAVLVIVYLADYALLRVKMSKNNGADALGTVTSYYGTALKDGKMEIFTDQPLTETCVRSLFPHSGLRPCWYASRNNVKPIG
jgi:hypothetical protein